MAYEYHIRPAESRELPFLPAIERSAGELFRTEPGLEVLADDEVMSVQQYEMWMRKWEERGIDGAGTFVAVKKAERSEVDGAGGGGLEEEVVGFIVTCLYSMVRCGLVGDGGDENTAKQLVDEPVDGYGIVDDCVQGQVLREDGGAQVCWLHVNELSVHVSHQHRGLGSRLVNAVIETAQRLSVPRRPDDGGSLVRIQGISLTTMRDVSFNKPFYEKLGFIELVPRRIGEVCGAEAVGIWKRDQAHFTGLEPRVEGMCDDSEVEMEGASGLERRRCWMVRKVGTD